MPPLPRNATPLLHTVGGKPHASSDDHHPEDNVKIGLTRRYPPGKENIDGRVVKVYPPSWSYSRPENKRPAASSKVAELEIPKPAKRQRLETRTQKAPELPVDVIDLSGDPPPAKKLHTDMKKRKSGSDGQAEANAASRNQTRDKRKSQSKATNVVDEDDVYADPESSSEVDEVEKKEHNSGGTKSASEGSAFKRLSGDLPERDNTKKRAKTKPDFVALKRSMDDQEVDKEDNEDDKSFANIHTASSASNKKKKSVPNTYGSAAKKTAERREKQKQKAGFQTLKSELKAAAQKAPKIPFKSFTTLPSSQSIAELDDSLPSANANPEELNVDFSEDEKDEVDVFEGKSRVKCSFCREWVPKSLKEDFEDAHMKDQNTSYKWDRRFCEWHRKRAADDLWHQRGYPVIRWDSLRQRMGKHDRFIRSVVDGKVDSHYLDLLTKLNKQGQGDLKDIIVDRNDNINSSAGYYGPKGEKIMYVVEPLRLTARADINPQGRTYYRKAFGQASRTISERQAHRQLRSSRRCQWLCSRCPCAASCRTSHKRRHESQRA